ncbi:SPASM domain-containing protein [Candidatus Pelagibacter bacterium]|jgi:radical SAM protein with 4Fe4S-binding SPASM domain|nr:SPASM domain-containing protein [Candidatus Pelagibacter bacterium]|tara:strand:- start:2332 stop:3225 length:894 start_codon:yes stop_codon:yes gene_type:complete
MKKEIKFIDPQLNFKKKSIQDRLQYINSTKIPLPSEVEISESGMCNRKCSFCPRSDPDYPDVNEFISEKLHKKLCDELSELNYSGLIIYSGFVEPMLDKNIYKLIEYAKSKNPKARIEIVSNGDVLNAERLLKIYDHGLDRMLISLYDGEEQYFKFKKLGEDLNLNDYQYVLRKRYLPEEQDFGITLSNRGGMLKNAEYKIAPQKEKIKQKCFYPSYKFFLDYNGDVLMCSHDWGKKNVLGNLNNQSFKDIWLSDKYMEARQKLNNSDRSISPCNVCDVAGTLIGSKHSKAWQKHKN